MFSQSAVSFILITAQQRNDGSLQSSVESNDSIKFVAVSVLLSAVMNGRLCVTFSGFFFVVFFFFETFSHFDEILLVP